MAKTYTAAEIKKIIDDEARKLGVDPLLAESIAQAESGGNPYAVGDHGTSFGLFNLHKGGELTAAGLTPQQAFDPVKNADVALAEVARQMKAHPGLDPGKIAALAQHPNKPEQYAQSIDLIMKNIDSGHAKYFMDAGSGYVGGYSSPLLSGPADAVAGAIDTVGGVLDPLKAIESALTDPAFWRRAAFVVAGFIIVLIAVGSFARGGTSPPSMPKPPPTPEGE